MKTQFKFPEKRPTPSECMDELLALADDLAGDALLLELLCDQIRSGSSRLQHYAAGIPEQTLNRLRDYLTQHTGELQVVARCLASQSSLVST